MVNYLSEATIIANFDDIMFAFEEARAVMIARHDSIFDSVDVGVYATRIEARHKNINYAERRETRDNLRMWMMRVNGYGSHEDVQGQEFGLFPIMIKGEVIVYSYETPVYIKALYEVEASLRNHKLTKLLAMFAGIDVKVVSASRYPRLVFNSSVDVLLDRDPDYVYTASASPEDATALDWKREGSRN